MEQRSGGPFFHGVRRPLATALAVALTAATLAVIGSVATADVAAGGIDPGPYEVTNGDASGPGSYHQAVFDAAASAGDDIINFDPGLTVTLGFDVTNYCSETTALTINGNGSTIDGNDNEILRACSATSVTVDDITLTGGLSTGSGAGALELDVGDVTIRDSTLTHNINNWSGSGGAVRAQNIQIFDSELSHNEALSDGGANGLGGAVRAFGTVTIERSTLVGNLAGPGSNKGFGGAVQAAGAVSITNSTLHDNTASATGTGDAVGGAVSSDNGGITVVNSTIIGNEAVEADASSSAGGLMLFDGDLTLTHATVAGNTADFGANVSAQGSGTRTSFGSVVALPIGSDNCFNIAIASSGYSYDDDDTCGFGSGTGDVSNGVDPLLGAAAGTPPVRTPQALSPLIDAIPLAQCDATYPTDQIGTARPGGSGCDIGAIEVVVPRPDNHIKRGSGAWVGNDVYNTTGNNQTRKGSVRRLGRATYYIRVQNDGNVTDSFKVKGGKHDTKWIVTYIAGGKNVSKAVKAGNYQAKDLAPGATKTIKMYVRAKKPARRGNTKTVKITSTSVNETTAKDTVKAITKRR